MKTIVQLVSELKDYLIEKDTAAKQAVESNIASVETDASSASKAYAVGQQLVLNDILYDVIDSIAIEDSLVVGTNIQVADNVSVAIAELASQNETLTNEVDAIVNVYGSKNILANNINSGTINGITITKNADKTLTVSGTASGDVLALFENHKFSTGNYILSGCPSGGSTPSGYSMVVDTKGYDTGNGFEFSIPSETSLDVKLLITSGTVITTPITFKPMIRDASIADDTYEPYSMTNQELTPIAQAVSNRNLLDNPWFTVNQRGVTSWSNEGVGFSADRWKHDGSATGNITNGVYTCNAPTYQNWEDDRIAPLLGKTVTLSWLLSDGTIGFETKTLPSALTSEYVWPFTNSYVVLNLKSGDASQAARITAGVAVKAVKLELGSVSTLAQDTAPNYQQELAKCQRYFYRHKGAYMYGGYFHESTTFRSSVKLPTAMRAIPSISFPDGIEYNQCGIYDAQGSFIAPSAVAVDNVNNVVGIPELLINSTTPTHTQYVTGVQRFNLTMDISADL